jgi:hypothetical protein
MGAMGHQFLAVASVAGRICVGLVFLLAAAQKMRHWCILSGVIANYRLLPRWALAPASALLPPVEMTIAIFLLCGLAMRWTGLASIILLALFATAMAINLKRGRDQIDCGCGQSFLKQSLRWTLVVRNAVLAVLLLPPMVVTGAVTLDVTMAGASAGLAFFLLNLLLNTLSALPRPDLRRHHFA